MRETWEVLSGSGLPGPVEGQLRHSGALFRFSKHLCLFRAPTLTLPSPNLGEEGKICLLNPGGEGLFPLGTTNFFFRSLIGGLAKDLRLVEQCLLWSHPAEMKESPKPRCGLAWQLTVEEGD